MTLELEQLRARVAARFPDVEQIDDSAIRLIRKSGDAPFAVYYLALAQNMPRTLEALTQYQDRIIGQHYFEGRRSLQWSNYLLFVTSEQRLPSSELVRAKEFIERDRNYARKLIVSEEDLDAVLTPAVFTQVHHLERPNILTLWSDRLSEAGLDTAIFNDNDLPARLAQIESTATNPVQSRKTKLRQPLVAAPPFIRSLELRNFRTFPLQKTYEFGAVNLIFGSNATGKTSLMEAIELLYCGRNKRNPSSSSVYDLRVIYKDGTTDEATSGRDLQLFRDRNLAWYGQSEVKTNNVYLSFAQFNFLNTDAAVSVAESTAGIEEDLSKLLVGPDASKTWRDIERVHEALEARLGDLRALKEQTTEELSILDGQIKASSEVRQESDSIVARLNEILGRQKWSTLSRDKETVSDELIQSSSELASVAQQAAKIEWAQTPIITIDTLSTYSRETSILREKAGKDIVSFENSKATIKRLDDSMLSTQEALSLLQEAERLIDAGVVSRLADLDKEKTVIATYSGWLVGLERDALVNLAADCGSMSVAACSEATKLRRTVAQEELERTNREYAAFTKLRDESVNLAQQLRQIAGKILQNAPRHNECPLCHTEFEESELKRRIAEGIDVGFEKLGQDLLNLVRERSEAALSAGSHEATASWLAQFCKRAKFADSEMVNTTIEAIDHANSVLTGAREKVDRLESEIRGLSADGLSPSRIEKIGSRLRALGHPLEEWSQPSVELKISNLAADQAKNLRAVEKERLEFEKFKKSLTNALGSIDGQGEGFQAPLSTMNERLAVTDSLRTKLMDLSSSFPWPSTRPLAELSVEAELIRSVAAELQVAIGREKSAQTAYAEATIRKEGLQKRLADLEKRLKRFDDAYSVLDGLRREHSLKKAMESSLQQNRAGIEDIFAHIHSPAEFNGLSSSWTALVRSADHTEAKLSEISTGQRSAFALSIFLAQNAQLTVGPPVILIDDPIAHVDDLNCLSFLDYLREIALTGRRQIFFATANDKLATLFERKFDFLGEGFRRFNLQREVLPTASGE